MTGTSKLIGFEVTPNIRTSRKSWHNQPDERSAFVGVLDQKLAEIADRLKMPLQKVRDI